MEVLNLKEIEIGYPSLSKRKGGLLYEACIVTLSRQKHKTGCVMSTTGNDNIEIRLEWPDRITEQIDRTHADQDEATEHAAECIGILLGLKLKGFTDVVRSRKGTGFDYYLGHKDDILFQNKARLEISGIFNGDEKLIKQRFTQKSKQTNRSDNFKIPAIISVTCFSMPHTQFDEK